MARKVKQFRYYGENNSNNQPTLTQISNGSTEQTTYVKYVNGEVFANYYPILQLGIQAIPGTKFYLNDSVEPIIVGYTGIYELDLEGQAEITKISFDRYSLQQINQLNNALLIVDIIYDDGTTEVS